MSTIIDFIASMNSVSPDVDMMVPKESVDISSEAEATFFKEKTSIDESLNEFSVSDYTQEELTELESQGYKFYAVYDDNTRVEVQKEDVHELELSPEFDEVDLSDMIQTIIEDSAEIAEAVNQHFWTDTQGVHVTDDAQIDWETEYDETNHGDLAAPTDQNPWHNILMNSRGIILRKGLINLSSFTASAVAFYDGNGNESANVMASFGRNGAQIGKLSNKHVMVNSSGLSVYDANGSTAADIIAKFDGSGTQIGKLNSQHAIIDNSGLSVYDGSGNLMEINSVDLVEVKNATDQAVEDARLAKQSATDAATSATQAAAAATAAQGSASIAESAATSAQGSASAAESAATSAQGSASSAQESALTAAGAATAAQGSASTAAGAATAAQSSASSAATSAQNAATDASEAKASAAQANKYSNAALDQLGVVQDVIGVLDYAAKHGTFSLTSDTTVQDEKVYFTYNSQSGDYVPVIDPQDSALSTYYELTYSDDSMGDFIMSHLAVTRRGLWVLPSGIGQAADEQHASGYKMLLSNDGTYIYDGDGLLVTKLGENIEYSSTRQQYIGSEDAYILFTPAHGNIPAKITIGGGNIQLGSSRTLSELMAEVDGTLIFKVTEFYSQDGSTATLTAHVYRGGEDIASQYADSCFAWYRKNEDGSPKVLLGDGRTKTVTRSTVGFGAAISCSFTEPNDSELLTGDDDTLTDSDDTPLAARTPSGDYVRVADLTATTTVFDTDRLMLVSSEEEQLVSIATLKDVFGDGDYERLDSKPSIEGVTLSGNKDFPDLGIFRTDSQGYSVADDYTLTTMDINALWANAQPIGG